jgi:hypothetical protein
MREFEVPEEIFVENYCEMLGRMKPSKKTLIIGCALLLAFMIIMFMLRQYVTIAIIAIVVITYFPLVKRANIDNAHRIYKRNDFIKHKFRISINSQYIQWDGDSETIRLPLSGSNRVEESNQMYYVQFNNGTTFFLLKSAFEEGEEEVIRSLMKTRQIMRK